MSRLGYAAPPRYEKENEYSVSQTELPLFQESTSLQGGLTKISQEMEDRLQAIIDFISDDFSSFAILQPKEVIQTYAPTLPPAARLFDEINAAENTTSNQKINARRVVSELSKIQSFFDTHAIKVRISADREILFVRKTETGMKYIIVGPENDYVGYGYAGNQAGEIDYHDDNFQAVVKKFAS